MQKVREMKKHIFFRALAIFVLILISSSASWAKGDGVRIGVLAKRGKAICLKKWTPTARYLSSKIPGKIFKIIPLEFDSICPTVKNNEVDFIMANPSFYVTLETWYGVERLATLKNVRIGGVYTKFGGVIFCRADRTDIRHLKDLKGKTFMAVKETSFGGWRMAWRELKEHGIYPYKDFAKLEFGGTHDAVVYAVKKGKVDAGTVRTDTLERMQLEGKINVRDFYVIHEHGGGLVHLPFLHSTRSYPEWPFAKLKNTPNSLAEKVAVALFQMPADSAAAKAAKCAGWTIPLNYQPVRECLQYLKVEPYKDYGKITATEVIHKYWPWLTAALLAFIMLTIGLLFILKFHHGLRCAHEKLTLASEKQKKITEALQKSQEKYQILVSNLPSIAYIGDKDWSVKFIDRKVESLTGFRLNDFLSKKIKWNDLILDEDIKKASNAFKEALKGDKSFIREFRIRRNNGDIRWIRDRGTILCDETGKIKYVNGIFSDVTRQKEAEKEKQVLETQLLQSEKMAAIGQLSAGIAHEINTPTQFVGDNTRFLQEACEDLGQLLKTYEEFFHAVKNGDSFEQLIEKVENAIEEADTEYLVEEIPKAIEQTMEGVERITKIVRSMKEFAHPGSSELAQVDINKAIESTVTVSKNEWKYVAHVVTNFDNSLQAVPCKAAEINQVVLNMIVNAAHAIKDVVGENSKEKGKITIKTEKKDGWAEIRISDTGKGIPEEIRSKIFDPFFTTKEVGKGTGMGLNLAYNIINNHGGKIDVKSEVGKGTTFTIRLPLDGA